MFRSRFLAAACLACACAMPSGAQTQKASAPQPQHEGLLTSISLADLGFSGGFRFANLGGRREFFVPLPQGMDLSARELALMLDDVSAHEARRSLEILVNDRSAAAIPLDGRGGTRSIRVPLAAVRPRDGFLKLTFLYSGAATQDRCIDVRYVGDSVTVRPESSIEIDVPANAAFDVASVALLMPRDVTIMLPGRRLSASDLSAALTVARALISSGRRVSFMDAGKPQAEAVKRTDRRWTRGLVLIGALADMAGLIDPPLAVVAGAVPSFGTLAAVKSGGQPALLVSESESVRAAKLFASSSLAALRGSGAASVGEVAPPNQAAGRVSFDELGLTPPQADVFGRAELSFSIATRALPAGTKLTRLSLDVMVAPDGAGENAVATVFVNERLLGSKIAAIGEPTHLDLPLPDGLVGATANVRTVIQRRSAQGDCRFEPQGYPAQILGSSAVIVERVAAPADDFSDLAAAWSRGVEILLPPSIAERPSQVLGLLASTLAGLSSDTAPIAVKFVEQTAAPGSAFIAIDERAPNGSNAKVRFDRGRVAVTDRSGRVVLDLGGFASGAVAQIVRSGEHDGLWIRPLATDRSLPSPATLHLDRGDVAFIDQSGVALAMSSKRDKLVRIAYPDQASWMKEAERYRSWIIGGLWLIATLTFLFALQRMLRRADSAGG
jgi:hypothetical protein